MSKKRGEIIVASVGNWAYLMTCKLGVLIARRGNDPIRVAHRVRHLGDAYYYARKPALAEPCYVEALATYRGHERTAPLDLANAVRSFAVLSHEGGAVDQAQRLWQEAHALYTAVHVSAGIAESAARLALLAGQQGELARSRECLREATAAADASGDPDTVQYVREVAAKLAS